MLRNVYTTPPFRHHKQASWKSHEWERKNYAVMKLQQKYFKLNSWKDFFQQEGSI